MVEVYIQYDVQRGRALLTFYKLEVTYFSDLRCVFQEYDYVFNVDIEDGKPPLKLPYNCDEDRWFAAQKFIHDNNLSQLYLDQVANFIVNNSKQGVPLAPNHTSDEFCDPFTG